MLARKWWFFLALFMFLSGGATDSTIFSQEILPLVIAHRGASGEYPESTLLAFQMALAQGADMLELDVRISADGHAVVFHDKSLERTTDGQGTVRAHSLSQLQALDAGFFFKAPGDADYLWRGKGLKIVTLAQVLKEFPDAHFIIDLKERDEWALKVVASVLQAHADPKKTIVFSLYEDATRRFRILAPEFEQAATPSQVRSLFFASKLFFARSPQLDFRVLVIPLKVRGLEIATHRLIRAARSNDLQVLVYTVNHPEQIRIVLAKGATGIITDYPGAARSIIRENQR